VPEEVGIPKALFERKGVLASMVSGSDARAIDLYLILLGQAAARKASRFEKIFPLELDLETLGAKLGLPKDWARSRMRRQIIKVLKKLAGRYGLIEAEFPFAKDAFVWVNPLEGETVKMPGWIFEPDFLTRQPPASAFLEMAGFFLKSEGIDMGLLTAVDLERRFGINRKEILEARSLTAAS
jgi:hypothetical protein